MSDDPQIRMVIEPVPTREEEEAVVAALLMLLRRTDLQEVDVIDTTSRWSRAGRVRAHANRSSAHRTRELSRWSNS